ncbi:glycoside hydrolase family 66 protein [Ktedonobacter sp. SOSP1-52]|uniref:glycoside hydrolase family 66 protein n=1 Tax=Ktedonobacter sp. SOSP1-52 TaxID=2778366 RepID=UPI001915975F|nr:glycoside hydrolase family 66 protein [Ktedonobacter sp. SOSP1-52]
MSKQRSEQAISLTDLWVDRAVYRPGEAATLLLLVHNREEHPVTALLHVALSWLDQEVSGYDQWLEIQPGQQQVSLPLALPVESFRGYGVDVTLGDEGASPWARRSTALDVLENWTQAPRYGFLSDFAPGDHGAEAACASLARYHVNLAQFYDWMWRHYILMPPEEEFSDALGRRVSLRVVREKVAACRAQGIAAMGYAAVYGAEPEYALEHPAEMLYDEEGKPYSLAELFYIMNIHADNPWRALILAEMARAVREVPFDGLHLDQYGFPKGQVFGPAPQRVPYDLAEDFPVFIDAARAAIREARPDARVIFNAVENWPIETVAPTGQDATYIEVWPPYTNYADLQKLILEARRLAPEKQVILAAYLTPLKGAREADVLQAESATRLASAAIWANGGFHLLMGERDGALCDPYYPLYASLRPEFADIMRGLYDFVVRYENTLSDPRLVTAPVDEVLQRIQIQGSAVSATGEAGTVWAILRQMPQFLTVSLINLSTAPDAAWNAPKPLAETLRDVSIELRVSGEITGVYVASPERDEGRPCSLVYRLAQRDGATWLQTTLPALEYWSVLTIKTTGTTDPA